MKTSVFFGTLAAAGLAAGVAAAGTLDDVKAKGFVQCGISTGVAGFAFTTAAGEWDGFDIAVCRAVATAVFGDPKAVKFTPTTGKTRFTALASGEISEELIHRNARHSIYQKVAWQLSVDSVAGRPRPDTGVVECEEHQSLAREAAEKSIV